MNYKITISKSAEIDVEDAFDWYEKQQTNLGKKFEKVLVDAIESLKENPLRFQIRYLNIRVCFTRIFPFGIHYQVLKREILILGVFHTSMSPKKWLSRYR